MIKCSRRWIISLMGIYSCALIFAQRSGMSVAMEQMSRGDDSEFHWNETLQGIILGASFYLYWIIPTIVGTFSDKFGGKWFAFTGVFGPCILTAITPWAARTHVGALIAVQTLVGGFHGFTYPSLFSLYVQWFPPDIRSKANSGIQVGNSVGSTFMDLIAGYLCKTTMGWPSVFYAMAAFHIPWILLWLYYGDSKPKPNEDWKDRNGEVKVSKPPTPWSSMLTSKVIWSSLICKSACAYGHYMFVSKMPAYLDTVHGIKIGENGLINSATSLGSGMASFLAPYCADWMINNTRLPTITIRKIFQSIGMFIPALCLFLATFGFGKTVSIILLIMAMVSYGFHTGGEWTTVSDYAPNFAGTVIGLTHMLGFSTGFIAPFIVGIIIDSNLTDTLEQKWNIVFYITSVLYVIGNVAFLLFGTDKQQFWDKRIK